MDPDYVLFCRVVEMGSFMAAGRHLFISPAMMSKRIARLELRLGIQLLHRSTRKVALTSLGAQLYKDVAPLIAAARAAEDRATNLLRLPCGLLRVSAPTSFGRLHIAPLIAGFLGRYPDVDMELSLTDAYIDLSGGRFDVAIRISAAIPASLKAHLLAKNRRILCASPEYLRRNGEPRTLAQLREHHLLAAEGQFPWHLASGAIRKVLDGRSHVQTNSSEIVRELAVSGLGIALRSLWDIEDLLRDGRLVSVLPEWTGPDDLAIFAVHPDTQGQPAVIAALVSYLQSAFRTAPWNHVEPLQPVANLR